jgi:hypothetical protein
MPATGANMFIVRVLYHQLEAKTSRDAIWAVRFSCHEFASHNLPTEGGGLLTDVIEIANCRSVATAEGKLID